LKQFDHRLSGSFRQNEFLGSFRQNPTFVMAGFDPAIHDEAPQRKGFRRRTASWMRGSSPRMTWRVGCINFSIEIFSM